MAAGTLVDLRRESYWIIDGIEIRHSVGSGIGSSKSDTPMPGHHLIQNCLIHHHHGVGVDESFTDSTTYRRNAVLYNGELSGTGMRIVAPAYDIVFEENEVAFNYKDGMKVQGDGTVIRRNYVHGQWMYQHADNMQTSGNGADDMLLEDNLIWNGGQSFMMSNMRGLTARNNVIGGSRANSMIFNGTYLILESNTLAFAGTGPVAPSGTSFNFSDNILMTGHNYQTLVMDPGDFTSDYNLFFFAEGIDEMDGPVMIWDRKFSSRGLAEYQADSGQDPNSLFANPMFVNAPVYYCKLDLKDRITEFTASRVYMTSGHSAFFEVGDYVEIDWDGVVRTVTAVGSDYIEFDPPETRVQFKAQALCNWGTNDDFALDLSPAPGSPMIGNGSGGGDIGSTIDVQDYMMCDFDGDGVRDVPLYAEDPNGPGPDRTPGDADGDGDVDLDDFVILKQTFGQSPLTDPRADFDGDGDVDLDDFVILKQNFGAGA